MTKLPNSGLAVPSLMPVTKSLEVCDEQDADE